MNYGVLVIYEYYVLKIYKVWCIYWIYYQRRSRVFFQIHYFRVKKETLVNLDPERKEEGIGKKNVESKGNRATRSMMPNTDIKSSKFGRILSNYNLIKRLKCLWRNDALSWSLFLITKIKKLVCEVLLEFIVIIRHRRDFNFTFLHFTFTLICDFNLVRL